MINSLVLTAYIRRFGYLLLPLSLSLALLGCNDQPSTVSSNNDTQMSQDSSANAKSEKSTNKTQTNGEDASVTLAEDIDNNDNKEGQSLIAAAKSDNPNPSIPAHRTLVENDSENHALQATLIGDYVGIYPCSFCSSISVTLNLFSDGSVAKTSIYHNPETPKLPHQESGVYRQDDVIITIAYDNKDVESYMIQDNHLVMMNEDDTLNADYTLSRK